LLFAVFRDMLIKEWRERSAGRKKEDCRMTTTDCNECANFYYDEDYEEYVCMVNMDEDDYGRLMSDSRFACPYYQNGDEYRVVRKQM